MKRGEKLSWNLLREAIMHKKNVVYAKIWIELTLKNDFLQKIEAKYEAYAKCSQ